MEGGGRGGGRDGQVIVGLQPSSASPTIVTSLPYMALALETRALELLEHGEASYEDACGIARQLLSLHQGPVALGAYVRVKAGIRQHTHSFPETTRFLARFLTDEFPGDSFLTLQVQMNRNREPHKDLQNTSMPSLICNLSPSTPGGTWVEDSSGSVVLPCSDGRVRTGKILTGRRYRLSARDLWHATFPAREDRVLLLGFTPAGWQHIPSQDMSGLLSLGFVAPHPEEERQGQLSRWGHEACVQQGLEAFGFRTASRNTQPWSRGRLKYSTTEVIICISSDEEDEDVIECLG